MIKICSLICDGRTLVVLTGDTVGNGAEYRLLPLDDHATERVKRERHDRRWAKDELRGRNRTFVDDTSEAGDQE